MIAMLMAVRIVDGTYTFKRVPKLLKAQVESCLADLGFKVVDNKLVEIVAEG
ncbi:hypothetical protein KBI51_03100 [Aerococcaceae bacterium zg-ZUI334]|uniref:CD1375 family protein n=1 Tax=Aerococcaceae TaxID=186827 RepID=UPI0019374934|nr:MULTISPECIES: hypothetical protein [unclassified Facklamia]MBR7927163.1 hypothetical protein [Aerococcaceae bacterium zg-ZUI334]MBS4461957.1 hypothetical protein [Aerococcaceae bacterium zg-B36]QQD64710.1 hypothetical protein JDW14_05060 [Aerococcaceae bacterium zg-252]